MMKKTDIIPVTKGKTYPVTIDDIGSGGEGVGKYGGFTVFVPGALPGEQVETLIRQVKKNYAKGEIQSLVTVLPSRTTPPCPYFPACGGCRLQHWTYTAQLAWKKRRVRELFRRIGGLDVEVEEVIGMKYPFAYRNKMQMPVGGHKGNHTMGFYAMGTHQIIDMDHCLIQDEENNALLLAVRNVMAKVDAIPYDEKSGTGEIRHIIGRSGTDGIMAIIVTATKQLRNADIWIDELRRELPQMKSFYHNYQPEKTNIILGKKNTLLWGKKQLTANIGELRFHLSPGSFFQVNSLQTEILYRHALKFAALKGSETVIDAYCGTGTISLLLAQKAKQVIGLENFSAAVQDAKKNAMENGIRNVEFIVGDAAKEMPALYEKGIRADVIVMDPPRAGCDNAVLKAAVGMQPQRIVYISCNPATLARDAAVLNEEGYRVQRVQPVDMFPHTVHIETVALLSKLQTEHHLDIEIGEDELSEIDFSKDATYGEIKKFVLDRYGLKVSSLYIAQVKRKHGLIERENYNLSKKENQRVPNCPEEKEKAIENALEYFGMI